MGREGKVASPALRGNANPRLLRHKLVFTTLRKHEKTESSQNCIPAGRRAGLWSRADSPPRAPPGGPGRRPARAHRARPVPAPRAQISASTWQSAGHARVSPAVARRPARRGHPGPGRRSRPPGRAAGGGGLHPGRMRAYQTGTSPQPGGCTSLTPGRRPAGGPVSQVLAVAGGRPAGWAASHIRGMPPGGAQRAGGRRGHDLAGRGGEPAQRCGDGGGGGARVGRAGDGPPDHQQVGAGPQRLLRRGRPGLVVG